MGAVGITGHGSRAAATHLEALRRFPFATVLTPLNPVLWREERFRADWAALVAEVQRQDAGLHDDQGRAPAATGPARRRATTSAGMPYATWYEPFDDAGTVRAALSWVLAHEEVTGVATAGDVRLLAPPRRRRARPAGPPAEAEAAAGRGGRLLLAVRPGLGDT